MSVRVKAGSALPKDKFALRNETIQTLAIQDPLSIAEGLDKPNPKEWARRVVYYRFFMNKYLTEFLGDEDEGVDNSALADIQALLGGQQPPIPESVSKKYLATFEEFMQSGGFKQIQDPAIKQNIVAFAEQLSAKAKSNIGETSQSTEEQPQPGMGMAGLAPAPVENQESGGGIIQRGLQNLMNRFKGA